MFYNRFKNGAAPILTQPHDLFGPGLSRFAKITIISGEDLERSAGPISQGFRGRLFPSPDVCR